MPERKRKFFAQSPEARRQAAREWVGKNAIVTIGRQETAQTRFEGKIVEVLHVTLVGDVLVCESPAKRFGVRLTDVAAINRGWGDERDAVRPSEAAMAALDEEEMPF